jgi:predicted dienelactone hydrolase
VALAMFRLLRLIILGVVAFAIALWLTNRAEAGVGVDRLTVNDPVTGKVAPTTLWYPSDASEDVVEIGPYRFSAARGGAPNGRAAGLIVISHGSGASSLAHVGSAVNLARAGYVVAAPTHPGDNFQDLSDQGTWASFSGRPRTISAVIDAVLADGRFAAALSDRKIGAMGLSRGGYTVLALVGARPDLAQLAAFCEAWPRDMLCLLGAAVPSRADKGRDLDGLADARVISFVVMAPGTALFADSAFAAITRPGLFFVAAQDGILAPERHAERFRAHWPDSVRYIRVEDAGHVSFATPLPPEIARTLPAFLRDPAWFDRAGFLARLDREIHDFFQQTLRQEPHP